MADPSRSPSVRRLDFDDLKFKCVLPRSGEDRESRCYVAEVNDELVVVKQYAIDQMLSPEVIARIVHTNLIEYR